MKMVILVKIIVGEGMMNVYNFSISGFIDGLLVVVKSIENAQ